MTESSLAADSPTETADTRKPPRQKSRIQLLVAVRTLGRPPRIMGLDLARGLAVIGMAAAHMADPPLLEWTDSSTWFGLVHGRSSILFALLAGISTALITGRQHRPEGPELPRFRLRLLGRGAAIFVIGLVLELLGTMIAIILCVYGVLFIAAIPFLRWRPRNLIIGAATLAIVGPFALGSLQVLSLYSVGEGTALALFGTYPVPVWMAFMLAGLAIGRMRFTRVFAATSMVIIGIGLAVIGYAGGSYADQKLGVDGTAWGDGTAWDETSGWDDSDFDSIDDGWVDPDDMSYWDQLKQSDPWRSIVTHTIGVEPHSGGIFEIVGSGGFVIAVVGLCLLISRPLRWILLPVACLGMMPLTSYTAHVLVFWIAAGGPSAFLDPSAGLWLWSTAALVAGATVWAVLFGRGPLERAVAWTARRAEGA